MIQEWININDLNDLLKVGKFTYVRKLIKEDLKDLQERKCPLDINISKILNITSNNTNILIGKIKILKNVIREIYPDIMIDSSKVTINTESLINEYESEFFASEAHQLVFYLTSLDGEERMEKLKIYKAYYYDKKLAGQWYHNILNKIHPDKLNGLTIKNTEKAIANLKKIYRGMKSEGN